MTSQVEATRPAARYVVECPLRWSDLDAYGHVNNARILTLYEEARTAMVFAAAAEAGVESFAEGVVIARHEVDYLRPIGYQRRRPSVDGPPTVRIEMWVEEVRRARFTIAYELYDGEVLAGRARSVLVPYDLRERRARRLTEEERRYLQLYLVEPGEAVSGTGRERA